MPRRKQEKVDGTPFRPATTPEHRELQLQSLAMDVAEEQMRAGSASSQVITHFLKAGSLREQLEQERIQHEIEVMKVKAQALEREGHLESLMSDAIKAMSIYSGQSPPEEPYEPQ